MARAVVAALCLCAASAMDPSSFFTGAKARPRLEVLSPENGLVLTSSDLEISISIGGWDHPSNFFGSSICIGVSTLATSNEKCFDETHELLFHVGGLDPDTAYTLRVVLFERDKAIAVSIRSFRVAGVVHSEQVLTIQTAVQVALQYQTSGQSELAEKIYRSVLSEVPLYPDALHLLGLVLHQKGSTETAITYIETALAQQGHKSFEGYHNSLGECYRVLGRIEDAETQFRKALAANPSYVSSVFNLGLVYQQSGRLESALAQYQQVDAAPSVPDEFKDIRVKSKIRECDLTKLLGREAAALQCWRDGFAKYPSHDIFHNEYGSVLLASSIHHYDTALLHYDKAYSMGNLLAGMNKAHVFEAVGRYEESTAMYAAIVRAAEQRQLSSTHMRIRRATLLPRVLPLPEQLAQIRADMEAALKQLLATRDFSSDGAPPTDFGFSAGFFLLTHGESDARLKALLARVYLRFCPALLTGGFVAKGAARRAPAPLARLPLSAAGDGEDEDAAPTPDAAPSLDAGSESTSVSARPSGLLKIALVSRFFIRHSVGLLAQGLVAMLARSGFEVVVVLVDGVNSRDEVSESIIASAHAAYVLPADLLAVQEVLREEAPDVIVFPEVGIDPVTYFLSFNRLAKVQVALSGHPETSGVPNVDVFISSTADAHGSSREFSERVHRMRGLGASFVDNNAAYSEQLLADLPASRRQFLVALALPSNAHVYAVSETLHFIHPTFDATLLRILSQDHLAHVLFIDAFNSSAIRELFVQRLELQTWKDSFQEYRPRFSFYTPASDRDALLALSSAHALLDPFPVSGYLHNRNALSVGTPVVTFPSDRLAGRLCLSMYSMLGYESPELVVASEADYVKAVLLLGHSVSARETHRAELLSRRHLLFDDAAALEDWRAFFDSAEVQLLLNKQ